MGSILEQRIFPTTCILFYLSLGDIHENFVIVGVHRIKFIVLNDCISLRPFILHFSW